MEHVRLGKTGLMVSRLCLGTMTFGLQCDEQTSNSILDRAAEGGVTFLDTADSYPAGGDLSTSGVTEQLLGKWLNGKRDQFIVATKCWSRTGTAAWDQGNSRKHILDAVDASLRRLGTDYIDLYQLHHPDPLTPLDETLEAMDSLVRSGKVRYIGVANWLAWQLALSLGRSEASSYISFASVQPRYNLLFREFERELFPLCAAEDIAVIPYNPIAGGMLSGKHSKGEPTAGTRFTLGTTAKRYKERYWHDRAFDTVASIEGLAAKAAIPVPTLALAWVLANPVVTAPIVGASSPGQLDATMAALDLKLDGDLKAELDELTVGYRSGDAER